MRKKTSRGNNNKCGKECDLQLKINKVISPLFSASASYTHIYNYTCISYSILLLLCAVVVLWLTNCKQHNYIAINKKANCCWQCWQCNTSLEIVKECGFKRRQTLERVRMIWRCILRTTKYSRWLFFCKQLLNIHKELWGLSAHC